MKISIKILNLAFLILLLGCNETITNRYANYEEAEAANLLKKGWLPDMLPVNTGEIIETHNIDTNQRCAEAVIPSDSISHIITDLKRQKFSMSNSKLPKLPFSPDKCQFKPEKISNDTTALAKSNEIVVLDSRKNKLYYWSF